MDPRKLDRALLMSLAEKYGDADLVAALKARDGWPDNDASLTGGVDDLDDFSACRITRKEDWVDLYAKPFYFGCEADDRTNGWAFSPNNPFGAKLNALYSSDIGHFDVIDMRDPLPEAYELVEDGLISRGQLPRLHLRQRGASLGHAEPALLRGHGRRQGGRRGAGERWAQQRSAMKSIGVRELRQRAGEYLRQVEAGQSVEITAWGRPVALLVPAAGRARPSTVLSRARARER